MDVRRVIARNVVRLRRERGISQEELSFRSKRTRAYLSGLERGRRNPTAVTLDKIATALGVSIVELFNRLRRWIRPISTVQRRNVESFELVVKPRPAVLAWDSRSAGAR